MVRAVFLDVGGVLVVPSGEVIAAALGSVGVEANPAVADLAHHAGTVALDRAGGSWEAYRRAWLSVAGVGPADLAAAEPVLQKLLEGPADSVWIEPRPGVTAALEALGALDVALAIVSNSDGTVEAILRSLGLCYAGAPAGPGAGGIEVAAILDSHVVGVAKPHPGMFDIACEQLGIEPADALHIGDTVCLDIHGAEAAGVRALHLDPYQLCASPRHLHITDLAQVPAFLADD